MSQAKTAEEVRREILQHLRSAAKYWAGMDSCTNEERCDGLVHSMLYMFDGVSGGLPPMDIVLRPGPEHKQFKQEDGEDGEDWEDWYEDGMVINSDCMLHEMYFAK